MGDPDKNQTLTSPTGYPLTSIIIVTHNQFTFTRQCLESIKKNTAVPYEIIVVDNASSDQTPDYLNDQKDLTVLLNKDNRGFPAAVNQGIAAAGGSFLLLLNNDVVVPTGWLERLSRPLITHPDVGLVGPCSNRVSGPQQIAVTYRELDDLDRFVEELARDNENQLQSVDRLVGFCLLVRRDVIDRVGLLDERFGVGNFEDDDFCRRAVKAGFKCAIARDAFVHHFGSVSFRGAGIDLSSLLEQNRQRYNEKWGTTPSRAAPARTSVTLPPISQAPRLSLCMIVRDSSATLPACLASIQPWVDEMIVVDTGSTDNTMEIARTFNAKVFEFPWCDSFAEARNQSLNHATGDWILWMDSDDTINAENGRKLRELVNRPTRAMGYIMQVRCPPLAPGAYATETVVDHIKMFRNFAVIRFTGRIHEQVLPSIRKLGGDVEWTDIGIVHSGSDQSPAGKARKFQRDLRLLEKELAEQPDDSFTLFNLGMTLVHSGRPADALNALARSLQLATPVESHYRKIYALLVQAYMDLGRSDTALKTCLQGLTHFPDDVELMFRKGQLFQTTGKLTDAEKAFRALIDRPDKRYFSSFDRGMVGVKAWHHLAVVHEKQNQWKSAADAWRKVLSFNRDNLPAWLGLVDALTRAGDFEAMEKLAGDAEPDIRTIALCRVLVARGDTATAIAKLRNAAEVGTSIEVLDELCRQLFMSDELDEAERWLSELARRRPNDPSVHLNLGTIHIRRGNHVQAEAYARRSLELRPNYAATERLLEQATKGK